MLAHCYATGGSDGKLCTRSLGLIITAMSKPVNITTKKHQSPSGLGPQRGVTCDKVSDKQSYGSCSD